MLVQPRTVLILPLFSMASGHRHAARALHTRLKRIDDTLQIIEVDLMERAFGRKERWLSDLYLKWISYWPDSYRWLYRSSVGGNQLPSWQLTSYRTFFLPILRDLIRRTSPDFIFCTHSLPSFLCNELKKNGELKVPAVNAYTDFFAHALWGGSRIEWHLAADERMAKQLRERGVGNKQIIVSGIPIEPADVNIDRQIVTDERPRTVLISGGHAGAGKMKELIAGLKPTGDFHYLVLCGKNKRLFKQLQINRKPHISALDYISDKQLLYRWYRKASAVISKAGGITLSECLRNQVPVFVFDALPGQEEWNVTHLREQQVVEQLTSEYNVEQQLSTVILNTDHRSRLEQRLLEYNRHLYANGHTLERLDVFLRQLVET